MEKDVYLPDSRWYDYYTVGFQGLSSILIYCFNSVTQLVKISVDNFDLISLQKIYMFFGSKTVNS